MGMTRKDYIALAEAIADANGIAREGYGKSAEVGVRVTATSIADILEASNPRFDRERFLKQCGCEVPPYARLRQTPKASTRAAYVQVQPSVGYIQTFPAEDVREDGEDGQPKAQATPNRRLSDEELYGR